MTIDFEVINQRPVVPIHWLMHLALKSYYKVNNKKSMQEVVHDGLMRLEGFEALYNDVKENPEKYFEALGIKH